MQLSQPPPKKKFLNLNSGLGVHLSDDITTNLTMTYFMIN